MGKAPLFWAAVGLVVALLWPCTEPGACPLQHRTEGNTSLRAGVGGGGWGMKRWQGKEGNVPLTWAH